MNTGALDISISVGNVVFRSMALCINGIRNSVSCGTHKGVLVRLPLHSIEESLPKAKTSMSIL